MSIGYATINFNNLTIGGDILALEQAGIFITEVKYRSDINASLTKTEIKSAKGTILNSSITLSESDPSSSITYTITLFNSNNYDCQFVGATFDADFYDNQNIIFELSDNIKEGILLASKQYITFDIIFKYKNGVVPNENLNTMNSYINFEFHSIAILQSTSDSDRTTFRTQKYREKIKKINFENKINIPTDAIESWDIGVSQNGDVMAYVVANKDDSNYYDLYIQSDTQLYANANMSYWFRDFNLVDSINGLELLDTSNTVDMSYMFSYTGFDSAVFTLDVSNFDTSNVIDMHYMFCKLAYPAHEFLRNSNN
jgi:surface protein